MKLAKATKNDELISKMLSNRKECESILDTCTKITHEANQVETSENVTRNDETLTRWEKEFEAAMSAYAAAEQELATPVVPTNVGENTNTTWSRASQPRANDPKQPNPLAGDAKPSELRAWQKRLKVFYDTHFMAEMPLYQQQAHFLSCLSKTLERRMNDVISDTTPVFSGVNADSCIGLLKAEFLLTYPLTQRRHDFSHVTSNDMKSSLTFSYGSKS